MPMRFPLVTLGLILLAIGHFAFTTTPAYVDLGLATWVAAGFCFGFRIIEGLRL